MTKDEILQKVNDWCNEKSYTSATLTDGFKDKFAEHFLKRYPEGDLGDEKVIGELQFALSTAFSGASAIISAKTKDFESKENALKAQVEELQKKLGEKDKQGKETTKVDLPQDLKDKLEELDRFKTNELKANKFKEVVGLAKAGIRKDLHGSFDRFVEGMEVELDAESKDVARRWSEKFQSIFKDTIGDIKPLLPQQKERDEKELIEAIPKVEVK